MKNPFARSRETTAMLEQAVSDIDPAEAAYEVLERLGARPSIPRFAIVGGLRRSFSADAENEAASISPRARERADVGYSITIDDAETVEVDDALSCEALDDGRVRARIHIALVADFVPFGGAIDREAAARATTVYLPETTVRMLPDAISCERASLLAGVERPVLTTEVVIGPDGNLLESRIYPALIPISARLDYDRADAILADSQATGIEADTVRTLNRAASALRERRRNSGASLTTRREAKVRVVDDEISIEIIDTSSPARVLVAEFMVLSNSVAARYAAENRIPMIYRVQPEGRFDAAPQRPRLSLFPEHHAGVGMDYYSQLSSPIRRYADLALQRQILTSVSGEALPYNDESLMTVLAGAENAEETGRDLERRAKRYWILRYLERQVGQNPLRASILREGSTAELIDFTVRGTLHNAPMLPNQSDVIVRIARVDPLRGWLSFDFVSEA
jgi:exoribonuclease-2